MNEYTDLDKLTEIEREIRMRQKVYPGLIAKNTITQKMAKKQIAIMEAIAEDYRKSVVKMELPI